MAGTLACGSTAEQTPRTATVQPTGPSEAELRAERERKEREERAEREAIVAKHRKLELAQQDALAGSCSDRAAWATQHCKPSCYPPEAKDPRAGAKLAGAVVFEHHVCERASGGTDPASFVVVDELDTKPRARPFKKRFPKPHKKDSWQAEVAAAFAAGRKTARGDAIAVGPWRTVQHPLTQESMRCATIEHYTRIKRGKLGDCGVAGRTACEASGNAAARGINLVHFRLAEARRLAASGNEPACRDAALEAVAVARGLPRWRQYEKLNVGKWTEGLTYKTRFDGLLDEDQLFAAATVLGAEAERVHAGCGGAMGVRTTPEQEQSFHTCAAAAPE